ncbi:MAG: hypothetical protein WC565_03990 [Parcubacteria group bacterium]
MAREIEITGKRSPLREELRRQRLAAKAQERQRIQQMREEILERCRDIRISIDDERMESDCGDIVDEICVELTAIEALVEKWK